MSSVIRLMCVGVVAACLAFPLALSAQVPGDPTLIIRGCVVPADRPYPNVDRSLLVWSDKNIMLTNVVTESASRPSTSNPVDRIAGTTGTTQPIFYWLDDDADDVAKHLGRTVEITGRMERELKKGEIEIDVHDNYTEVKFEAHGKDVKARVPPGFLGEGPRKDADYDIVLRDVDVRNVRVLSEGCR